MKKKHKRLYIIILSLLMAGVGVYILSNTLQDNITYFRTPTEVMALDNKQRERRIRLGGVVEKGSIRNTHELHYEFAITDGDNKMQVTYEGIIPDLFEEGKGAVVEGNISNINNTLIMTADKVLAKHDENYMPPEIARQMRKQ